jgi:predicted RNA methylase
MQGTGALAYYVDVAGAYTVVAVYLQGMISTTGKVTETPYEEGVDFLKGQGVRCRDGVSGCPIAYRTQVANHSTALFNGP